MKAKRENLSRQYQAALRTHLKSGPRRNLRSARLLGHKAMTAGLKILDLAKIHGQSINRLVLGTSSIIARKLIARRAGTFFAEAITPLEETHPAACETSAQVGKINEALRQYAVDLAILNGQLKQETLQRKLAEQSLRKSEHHYAQLLEQSRRMQDQLRYLSRQLLSAQEEERKKISRELHDVIAQTLTGINVRLSALKKESTLNTAGLERNIASTQQLVQHSVDIVHRFARELRPAVLDDLGLIPALHTFLKMFREQTGIHASLSSFAAIEQVSGEQRTVLYRVAQEALNNVARHAKASQVDVKIQKINGSISMIIRDNGIGFPADRVLNAKKQTRLGLIGMRERVEMINGSLLIQSALGQGTTIQAQIPFQSGGRGPRKAPRLVRTA